MFRGGGIVIALLGPIAVNERALGHKREDQDLTLKLRRDRIPTYADKYRGDYETSYDWLDQGFLNETRLDALYKKRSSNISVLARWE